MERPTKYIRLIFILVAIGCSRPTNDSASKAKTTDQKIDVTLLVKDSTKYSSGFLTGLRHFGPGRKFELTDNKIVTDDHYHNEFPEILPLNKEIVLTATKDKINYRLTVSRVNYTTISYNFRLTGPNGEIINEKGKADLSSGFMLGSSTGEDDKGNVYPCYDYFSIEKKCIVAISIGNPDNKFLGQVDGCGDYLNLDATPILK